MGETIRFLMVAAIAIVSVIGNASAQTAGSGFSIPDSLSGAVNSASQSIGLPGFTGGLDPQRATTRAGGPSTEPAAVRDNAWASGQAARRSRPTTDPFSTAGAADRSVSESSASSNLNNQLRAGAIAMVAATEDPNSVEAQMRAQAREKTAAANQAASSASGQTGFGTLPKGISLPERGQLAGSQGPGGATFGSEFANNPMTGSATTNGAAAAQSNPPPRPVFGPLTAEQANFDPSLYNANQYSAGQTRNSQQTPSQTQATFGLPGSFASTDPAAGAGTSLGMPGAAAAATMPVPSNWTYKQIAALGEYFGVPSNDSRMSDKAFVNKLYALYREDQAKKGQAQTATGVLAGGGQMTGGLAGAAGVPDPWATTGAAAAQSHAAQSQLTLPGFTAPAGDAAAGGAQQYVGGGQAASVSGSGRRVELFDSFGNRIDAEGNILDAYGRPVDEATRYELTIGKKLREDMEKLTREQVELDRKRREAALSSQPIGSPSDRIASNDPSLRLPRDPRSGAEGLGSSLPGINDTNLRASAQSLAASGQRPPTGGQPGAGDSQLEVTRAGIGGASGAITRSNPYVNVFLLCSLVANAFLFISLHRLWYHHRDLIASSRMASSGITTSD